MRVCLVKLTNHLNFKARETDFSLPNSTYELTQGFKRLFWKLDAKSSSTRYFNSAENDKDLGTIAKELLDSGGSYQRWMSEEILQPVWRNDLFFDLTLEKNCVNLLMQDANARGVNNRISASNIPPPHDPMGVEVLLEFGNNYIIFNGMRHLSRGPGSLRLQQIGKYVPVQLINNLRDTRPNQLRVAVYGVFKDAPPPAFKEDDPVLDLAQRNWKMFKNQCGSDMTIVSSDRKLIDCHRFHVASNSSVLGRSPFITKPRERRNNFFQMNLTGLEVEAFLRYQYTGSVDKILESPGTSLALLHTAMEYRIWVMWNDIIAALHHKDSDWFRSGAGSRLTKYLKDCPKRREEPIQNLLLKLSQENSGKGAGFEQQKEETKKKKETGFEKTTKGKVNLNRGRKSKIKKGIRPKAVTEWSRKRVVKLASLKENRVKDATEKEKEPRVKAVPAKRMKVSKPPTELRRSARVQQKELTGRTQSQAVKPGGSKRRAK